jgi:hypothetical protein
MMSYQATVDRQQLNAFTDAHLRSSIHSSIYINVIITVSHMRIHQCHQISLSHSSIVMLSFDA